MFVTIKGARATAGPVAGWEGQGRYVTSMVRGHYCRRQSRACMQTELFVAAASCGRGAPACLACVATNAMSYVLVFARSD